MGRPSAVISASRRRRPSVSFVWYSRVSVAREREYAYTLLQDNGLADWDPDWLSWLIWLPRRCARDRRGENFQADTRLIMVYARSSDGRKRPPLSWLTLGMASLGVSWVGLLRVCNSHGGSASGQASAARGGPFAGRDRHGDPLHTDQCFWRLLLALCALATPEAVLGECVAMLLRLWIEPRRKLHR